MIYTTFKALEDKCEAKAIRLSGLSENFDPDGFKSAFYKSTCSILLCQLTILKTQLKKAVEELEAIEDARAEAERNQ